MVQIPNTFQYNFWSKSPTANIEITCFMPNGVVIPCPEISPKASLAEIKTDIWEEASKYPLHGTLRSQSSYVFVCINSNSETEELRDESRRLCDIKPFCCILRLIEKQDNQSDKILDSQIGVLIGKGLIEFTTLKNSEINDFRWKMRLLADEVASERQKRTWAEKVQYQFPTRLAPSSNVPKNIESRLKDEHIVLVVKFENADTSYTFSVKQVTTSSTLVLLALNKRANTLTRRDERPRDFTLKVCGQDEYLIGDEPLIRYTYIRECISKDINPTLVAVNISNIPVYKDHDYEDPDAEAVGRANRPSFSTLTLRKRGKYVYSLEVEQQLVVNITSISRLNTEAADRTVEVVVQSGLFHGGRSLCESKKTKEIKVNPDGYCQWNEDFIFDIKIRDIPKNARLCFVLYEVTKSSSKGIKSRKNLGKQEAVNPLCWVNTTIYDYKSQLKSGGLTLYMWAYADDIQNDDLLHPLGTVVSNPDMDRAAALLIDFKTCSNSHTVLYPSGEKMVEFSKKLSESRENSAEFDPSSVSEAELEQHIEQLQLLADQDPLHELHEQERKTIWSLRQQCITKVPTILAKLLQCVEWNDHKEVAEATSLVLRWPKLEVERALELLDYAYPDPTVRSFAVKCLKDVSDDDLSLFLLQLVQALKHENHLSCELSEFLLRRALNNQRIGHFLFWHLKSEMHVGAVNVRFGLMLEAYCRGSQEHMRSLAKQVECLRKLDIVSDQIKLRKDRKAAQQQMVEYFKEDHCREAFTNVTNPLNPSFRWSGIRMEKCRVMDSKMRPLHLVFKNVDPFGDDIHLIFKQGDDLRQDMLTLQMLCIMEKLWQKEDLDFRLITYRCISTDNRVGLIEVVLNAETIANIQKEKMFFTPTAAFKRGLLLAWLKEYNHSETSLNKAIEEFTLSCAGYCVATYVLGIADRHSDNIMVKRTGQLFHIDFGHILGHFKEKFGFRRERVPFVLVNDFIHTVTKGQGKKANLSEFYRFQNSCEQAFLILRRHGSLILSLFAMMMSTGLPELSSEKDLNYLRDTLVLEASEAEAQMHFRSKFEDALRSSWKTSLNWASHNMSKNNKVA
ncbi:phosphatidylinositol 4,5-bisphosphate 3-kinase catalytic subunit delta isoform [Copidosoma floridanum]|uniref:phosphatidylinositol 4,5-bisphosphate 3-kinase catalytic subunit delta isoform n=1 Tax=Copidosoma floridanum TaxID=29053 RepID=UPI0006C94894|nr:phosphatidylinositol 4,5-bisphosphate 3-kinase catalytic subunit delta isoform [Copidosoma floridanum]XP_014210086.1 phosphatidylinositol 4,5-bisphosphate 3-kinase catalytic subunit delta isoform [Copidosoma floridanum]